MKHVDSSDITLTLDIISETAELLKAKLQDKTRPPSFSVVMELLTDINENWLEAINYATLLEVSKTHSRSPDKV